MKSSIIKYGLQFKIFLLFIFLLKVDFLFAQTITVALPNNGNGTQSSAPQGALRFQRGFYLIQPAEMSSSGLANGMNVNSIGFTIGAAQGDTTKGGFKVYLQNTADTVSRVDTSWTNIAPFTTNEYSATALFPGNYEWQVKTNCSPYSVVNSFSNKNLPQCNPVTHLSTTDITDVSARLNWVGPASGAIKYYVEYSRVDIISWVIDSTTQNFYIIASGLIPDKGYQWRVRVKCSVDISSVVNASFNTESADVCNEPLTLTNGIITDTSATLNWVAAAGASYYNIRFRRTGTSIWYTTQAFTNSVTINFGLSPGTTYEWQVRTKCPSGTGAYVQGTNFTTTGTIVCYAPENLSTDIITGSSAKFTWAAVSGATSYQIRYRLKDAISWVNVITPMTIVHNDSINIPDTIGRYQVLFVNGSSFTYTGGGVYVAWEYRRPTGVLPSANTSLGTNAHTTLKGSYGQDSVQYILSFNSRNDSSATGLDSILNTTNFRPETSLGSSDLKDSVAVMAVYSLGKMAPAYSNEMVSALVRNFSGSANTYTVTMAVKDQKTNAIRFSTTQSITVAADTSGIVSFTGWMPGLFETDSVIVSIPTQSNENVVNNNRNHYLQTVTRNIVGYDDGSTMVGQAGRDTLAGLTLSRHYMKGCGKIISAQVYLTISAKNQPLQAVVRNTAGAIVAQSAVFSSDSLQTNKYHTFYFDNPPSFLNEDYYIGLLQQATAAGFNPVGAQWENGETRKAAYYRAAADGSGLIDYPQEGRLMIKAEIVSSSPEPFISGNLILCTGGTNILTAGSTNSRFANSVIGYSSQYDNTNYSAMQVLGTANVFPMYALSPDSWLSNSPDGQREFLVIGFADPAPINYVDIYETANPGAVDSIFVKNPGTLGFDLVYSATASAAPPVARKNRISFPLTAFNVSEIRIAINSPAVSGYNAIDAVGIGKTIVPGVFTSYLWTPGGETTATKSVSGAGLYKLTVTNASGCQSSDSVNIVATVTTPPVITASGPGAICQGDSLTLTSSRTTGNTWSTGVTTQSITVSTAGSYTVSYNDGSGCGVLTSLAFIVTVNSLPSVTISGSLDICIGNQNVLDAGSGFSSYLWSTGETTQTISVGNAGIYSVRVTNSNGCRNSASVTTVYTTLAAPVITGNLSFCPGGSTVLDAGTGYSSYLWSTGATSQTITVTTAGNYDVEVSNANGCTASQAVVTSLFTPPVPSISGAPGFCAGGSTVLTANAGYAGYLWSTGSTAQSITVSTAGTYSVTVTDNNGCTGSTSIIIAVFPNPAPVISGTLSFCGGTSTTLNAGPGYSSYLWSTGATTQIINVNTVATFTVTVTNANGCTASASAATTNTGTLPATPGPITGPVIASCNTTGNNYSISPVSNTTHYVWNVPSGATIVSGQGTTAISVNFGPSFQGGNIVVAASNACGQSPSIIPRQLFVQSLASTPGSITGQSSGLCGPTTNTYSIAAVPMATSYTWSVPAGANIISGQTTTSVTVSFSAGFSFGNLCVTANNACGSSIASCKLLSGVPPTPGAINGSSIVCRNQSNLFYGVDAVVGATSYTWTVPQSANIAFGQGSNNIVVNMGPNSGNITVKANSACGSSNIQVKAITVTTCLTGAPIFTMEQIRPVPEVVSSYGGFTTTDKLNIEWTLGEPRIESENKAGLLYTQGFHQPLVYYIPVKETDSTILVTTDNIKITVYPNPVSAVLKVKIETADSKPLVLELRDTYSRLLQRKNINSGKELVEIQMTGYIGGSYYLLVRDTKGQIINTIKLVKVD